LQVGITQPGAAMEPVLDLRIGNKLLILSCDLEVRGTIKSAASSDTVLIQSGTVSNGMLLPLPPGITYDQIGANKAIANYVLTPAATPPPPGLGQVCGMYPLICDVDQDWRVQCRIAWLQNNGAAQIDVPVACDFTVMVTVPQAASNP
jgi:hypothetical protein